MSEYDDDEPEVEEPTPEPPAESTPAGTVSATVSREELVELVAGRFYAQLCGRYDDGGSKIRDGVARALNRLVKAAAEEEIARLVGEGVAAAVGEMLAKGWTKTDQYGQRDGTVTVQSLVVQYLTVRGGSYNDRETRLETWTKALVEEAIKKEMGPLIEQAKKQVRDVLDKNVTGAIRRALLDGAGIRE